MVLFINKSSSSAKNHSVCLVTFTPRGQVFISPSHPHNAYSAPPHHIAAATGHWSIGHVLEHSPNTTQPYSRPPNLAQDPSGVKFRLTPSRGATVFTEPRGSRQDLVDKNLHLAHKHTTLTAIRGHENSISPTKGNVTQNLGISQRGSVRNP
eukprot:sb/3473391/